MPKKKTAPKKSIEKVKNEASEEAEIAGEEKSETKSDYFEAHDELENEKLDDEVKITNKRKKSPELEGETTTEDVWDVDVKDKVSLRKLSKKLMDLAREKQVKIPRENSDAMMVCGPLILSSKSDGKVDPNRLLESLIETYGQSENESEQKVKKSRSNPPVVEANFQLVQLFREIGKTYFKLDKFKGSVYQKAATAINECPWEITLDKLPTAKKGPMKIPNIGKASIDIMKEFLETGKAKILEELKSM
mmetsp:Transcript_20779/g.30771  ORF Transcript_20779/g.30771 Transcript_20779/m.30771 type:complete len:248 (+) Transcript_20779:129-872(+)